MMLTNLISLEVKATTERNEVIPPNVYDDIEGVSISAIYSLFPDITKCFDMIFVYVVPLGLGICTQNKTVLKQ